MANNGKKKKKKKKAKQVNTKQVNTKQVNAKQVNTKQVNAKQVNTKQVNTKQVNTKQVNTKQVNTKQVNTKQVNTKCAINYHYASFWIRLLAFLIDGVISGIVGYVVGFLWAGMVCLLALVIGGTLAQDIILDIVMYFIGFMTICLYFSLMENCKMQATLGKKIMGIKVINLSGERITFDRSLIRFFAKILSGIILGIGYLMVLFNPKKQGLHDRIAKTYVIKNN